MKYNKACKKFKREVKALCWDWRRMESMKYPFDCETPKEEKGDKSLYRAHKKLSWLTANVECLQANRTRFIDRE